MFYSEYRTGNDKQIIKVLSHICPFRKMLSGVTLTRIP